MPLRGPEWPTRRASPVREEDAQHSLSIAGRVGSETRLREALSEVSVSTLVTDGQMDVSDVADRCGRCRWHLPRSVRYLLPGGDVSGDRNQQLTSEVRELAYTDYGSPVAARTVLTR